MPPTTPSPLPEPTAAAPAAPGDGAPGLRPNCLSFPETLSQCVANISPTLTPVMIVPLVFASAGDGTWLAYLFATVGLVLVGFNINQFARRSASPGSLYTYIAHGLGTRFGFIAGWALISAYLFTGMSVLSGSINYALILLAMLNLHLSPILLFAGGALLAWYIAYSDVRLSTRVMLVLELASMLLILALGAIVVARRGQLVDPPQFHFAALNLNGLKAGLILAIFSFVGYESAATLGAEARHPLVNIPRAIIYSAVISGLFFMVTAYVAVLGFRGLGQDLGTSDAPFSALANAARVPFFGVLISVGAVISMFACTLASLNAGARIVYSLGRHGVFHPKLGQAHRTNETPHHAVSLLSVLTFALPAVLLACKVSLLDVFNDLSTIATYGFLVVYALVSVSALVYVRRIGRMTPGSVLLCGASLLFLVPALVATVYPAPAPPLGYFPYLFLAYLALGASWFALRHRGGSKQLDEHKAALAAAPAE